MLYHQGYYYSGDGYDITMNYAKLELREKDGLKFWPLIAFEQLNDDGSLEYAPRVRLTGDNVNLREEPSVDAGIISRARKGDEFFLIDTEKDEKGTEWYKVVLYGTQVYIRSDLAKPVEP